MSTKPTRAARAGGNSVWRVGFSGRSFRGVLSALFAALLLLTHGAQASAQGSSDGGTGSLTSLGLSSPSTGSLGSVEPSPTASGDLDITMTERDQILHVEVAYSGLAPSTQYSIRVGLRELERGGPALQASTRPSDPAGSGVWEFAVPMQEGGSLFECYTWLLRVVVEDARGRQVAQNGPHGELAYTTCGSLLERGVTTRLTVKNVGEVRVPGRAEAELTAHFSELEPSTEYLVDALWIDSEFREYGRSGPKRVRTDEAGEGALITEITAPVDAVTECRELGADVEISRPDGTLVRSNKGQSFAIVDLMDLDPGRVITCPVRAENTLKNPVDATTTVPAGATIVDTITYSGLDGGQRYTVVGEWHSPWNEQDRWHSSAHEETTASTFVADASGAGTWTRHVTVPSGAEEDWVLRDRIRAGSGPAGREVADTGFAAELTIAGQGRAG